MGMVIDIGLERYYYGDPEGHLAALRMLVADGHTRLVRDIFDAEGNVVGHQEAARIYEVRRFRGKVQERWLPDDEAAPILEEVRGLPYASLAWHQFDDELGGCGQFIQDLALKLENRTARWIEVTLSGDHKARLYDVSQALKLNWTRCAHPEAKAAARLHRFARKHGMIVHSA